MENAPVTREDRVHFIMRQMAADPPEWPVPQTPAALTHRRQLAAEWGCAEATIRDYAAEASRNLRADPGERDYLRMLVARRFERMSIAAETLPHAQSGLPDMRAAIEALDKQAEYLGLKLDERSAAPDRIAPRIEIVQPDHAATVEPGAGGDDDGTSGSEAD